MIDNALAHSGSISSSLERPRAFDTILYGGLAVGILDGSAAVILSSLKGVSATRVFQYIASGMLGRASYNGGLTTVLLGVLIHFLIAFTVATVYYRASLKLPMLVQRAALWGPIYGIAVHFAMRFIVLPLSAVQRPPFTFSGLLQNMIVHALCVGLPVALIARRSAKMN